MTYASVITAVKARLDTSPLANLEVSVGDYDTFNESHSYVVVLDYGGMAGERAELVTSFFHTWQVEMTLGVMFTHPQQAHDDMATLRQHCLDRIGDVPKLAEATYAFVSRGEPLPDLIAYGGIDWQMETLTVTVQELAEY